MAMLILILLMCFCAACLIYAKQRRPGDVASYKAVVKMVKDEWKKFPDFSMRLVDQVEVLDAASDTMKYAFEVKDRSATHSVYWPTVSRDAGLPKFEANETIFVLEMEYSNALKRFLKPCEVVISKRSTDSFQQKKYGP